MSTVHVYKNRLHRDLNLLVLLIPSIIFILVAVYLMSVGPKQKVASDAREPSILGREAEILDNSF